MTGQRRYMNVAEAAAHVRRHPGTLRRSLEAGEVHGTQRTVGGRWTIRVDCLEAWIEGRPCEHQAQNVTAIGSRRTVAS